MTGKKMVYAAVLLLAAAIAANKGLLALFDQTSSDRSVHSLVGIFFLMGLVLSLKQQALDHVNKLVLFVFMLIPCYLGTVFPDLDITLLGIGGHRNPLFHSGIAFFAGFIVLKSPRWFWAAAAWAAFGTGIGSHLIWDLFSQGDVRYIPGRMLDNLWLGLNGVFCLAFAWTSLQADRSH